MTRVKVILCGCGVVCHRFDTSRYPKRNISPVNYHENFPYDEQKRILQNIYPHLRTKKWLKEYILYYRYYVNNHILGHTSIKNKIAYREWKRCGISINSARLNYYCLPSSADILKILLCR